MYDFFKQEKSAVNTDRRLKTTDFDDEMKDNQRVETLRHRFKAVV